ncbi:type II CAAX endopeptidase family protein [Streptomyces olivoverticillatus]
MRQNACDGAGTRPGGLPGPHSGGGGLSRRTLRSETLLVLALSLGASAVSSLISFVGAATRPGGLKDQAATLNASHAPRPPLAGPRLAGVRHRDRAGPGLPGGPPADARRSGKPGGLRAIGFDRTRPGPDLARGAAIAACIGGAGLAFYLVVRAAGFNLTVVPENLPHVWWRIPVLVASAVQNAVLEEVVVVGYLLRRLDGLGWTPVAALAASAVLRGSYHLYQGDRRPARQHGDGRGVRPAVPALGGRVGPLVAAHALIDVVAFVGYALLAGKVGWLPTA